MKPFEISRVLDAPRERVWQAWTDPRHLINWWGPKGCKVTHLKADVRPGGITLYCLRWAEGGDFWGKFAYREVVKPERLVWINSFSDPDGGTTRHPGHASWPLEMHSTALFEALGNRTRVTIQWLPHNATAAEAKTFDEGRDSMNQGWGGTFEQCSAYLAKG